MNNPTIRAGQLWQDKKNGNIMLISSKYHDIVWNCVLQESKKNHKMPEFVIKRHYICLKP